LAENEDSVRNLVRAVLEEQGYRVFEAESGPAALTICESREETIHLLITDVVMPQMSGPELAHRAAKLRPGIRVLFMSGFTDNAVVRQGVLLASGNFIQKPFQTFDLARKVREVLDAPQSGLN
jgi:CheY-like chemotaxis protein